MNSLIILNYATQSVDVLNVSDECKQVEDCESALVSAGYSLDNINWMEGDKDGTPVFYNTDEFPTYTL